MTEREQDRMGRAKRRLSEIDELLRPYARPKPALRRYVSRRRWEEAGEAANGTKLAFPGRVPALRVPKDPGSK